MVTGSPPTLGAPSSIGRAWWHCAHRLPSPKSTVSPGTNHRLTGSVAVNAKSASVYVVWIWWQVLQFGGDGLSIGPAVSAPVAMRSMKPSCVWQAAQGASLRSKSPPV